MSFVASPALQKQIESISQIEESAGARKRRNLVREKGFSAFNDVFPLFWMFF